MHRPYRRASIHRGGGLLGTLAGAAGTVVNKAIDILPTELHFPNYSFCGPGTNLRKRLARGDRGINQLDSACREHDIAYSKYKDNTNRSAADRVLAEKAWERVKSNDSSLGEKTAAWLVTNIMKAKAKLGGGGGSRNRSKKLNKKSCRKTVKSIISKMKRKNKKKKSSKKNSSSKKGKGLYLKPYRGSGKKKTS